MQLLKCLGLADSHTVGPCLPAQSSADGGVPGRDPNLLASGLTREEVGPIQEFGVQQNGYLTESFHPKTLNI
jgi:hypothetical protein